MKNYLIFVKTPLIIISLYVTLYFLMNYNYLPPLEEIEILLISYYERYGLYAVALLSLIENIPGINVYFPGSIVILTAMAYSHGNPLLGLYTYLTIYSFAFVAYNISYYLGRLGASSNNNKRSFKNKNLFLVFLATLWHPHSASITCLASGENKIPYLKFLRILIITSFIWNTFWALLMYNIDIKLLITNGSLINILVIIYLFLWLGYDSYKYFHIKN